VEGWAAPSAGAAAEAGVSAAAAAGAGALTSAGAGAAAAAAAPAASGAATGLSFLTARGKYLRQQQKKEERREDRNTISDGAKHEGRSTARNFFTHCMAATTSGANATKNARNEDSAIALWLHLLC
jgi:hypothetical protein